MLISDSYIHDVVAASGGFANMVGNSVLTIKNTSFERIAAQNNGVLAVNDNSRIIVKNSSFRENWSNN